MWVLITAILLVPVNGFGNICDTDPDRHCHSRYLSSNNIPKDYEELKRNCPLIQDNLACLHQYDLACSELSEYEALPYPIKYENLKSFVDQACREGSSMNRVLGQNLGCIKSRTMNRNSMCSKSRQNALDAYHIYYNTHSAYRRRVGGSSEKKDRVDCLYNIYTTGCVLKHIENDCGYKAYEVGETLIKTNVLLDICDAYVLEELAEILDDMGNDIQYKDIIKKLSVIYNNN